MILRDGLALFAMLAMPAMARAQTIRGAVVDRADSVPVPGVVVFLLDASDNVAARALTNERGEFRLPAAAPGTYRVRTLRIGFRPVMSAPIELAVGEDLMQRIFVAGVPFSLDTVRVEGRSSTCRIGADSAMVTYAVWEQVRTALAATDLSGRVRNTIATTLTYERFLDPRSKRIRRQASKISSGPSVKPWVSVSADSLRRLGYVTKSSEWIVFNAPDLDVLLSDKFLEDHCFRVVEANDVSQLGLAFEPTRERKKIPEIRGTIWLDRKSSELRRMEFLYTNVSREQEDGRAGGDMDFVRMKHGAWAISRWNIRMPLLAKSQFPKQADLVPSIEPDLRVFELKVAGGELVTMRRASDTLWAHAPLVLVGTVRDSSSGRALAGARVSLQGLPQESQTNATGSFSLAGVMPGEYTIRVRTTALDSLAVAWEAPLSFTETSGSYLAKLPSASEMLRQFCPNLTTSQALVVGQVRVFGDTTARRDAGVFVDWADFSVNRASAILVRKTAQSVEARTDANGAYRICGVPINTRFVVQAEVENAAPVVLSIPPNARFVRVDIVGGVDSSAPKIATGASGAVLTGTVVNDSKSQPIAGADVSLPALRLGTRTGATGAFRIPDIPAGTYQVTVRQIGYAPVEMQVGFTEGASVSQNFALRSAQVLDSVVVAARRPSIPEFEERRKSGIGRFITREELAKAENHRMSELLTRVGGLRVVRASGGSQAWIAAGRGALSKYDPDPLSAALGAKPDCYVDVWLDGVRMYTGGQQDMLWDVNSMQTGILEGIEFYAGPSEIPPKYTRANQNCGVLVLWTRRGP